MDILVRPPGILTWRGKSMRCALGHGGLGENKREGDGVTPVGCFPLRRALYRADRVAPPATALPLAAIRPEDGWCDDPDDAAYNTFIHLPHSARHEVLWRDDGLYDVLVILGYNDNPAVTGLGSAIFLHIAETAYRPTEGCVALAHDDLADVLGSCDRQTRLCVSLP